MAKEIDIQFRGNKVVVIEVIPDWQVTVAHKLVTSAINGDFKFAWLQFKKPLPKDYATNPRSMKWARNHTYDAMADKTGVKEWRTHLTQLRNALKLLFRKGEVKSYHVDGTGRLNVTYSDDKSVMLHPDKVPCYSTQRHPVSITERKLRTKGKVRTCDPEIYSRLSALEEELARLQYRNKIKAVKGYGENIDVSPPTEYDLRRGGNGISYLGNPQRDMSKMIEWDPTAINEEDIRTKKTELHGRTGTWAYLCTLAQERSKESGAMVGNMWKIYTTHIINYQRR